MSQSLRQKKGRFLYRLFCPKTIVLRFAFYLNVECIEYTFRIYILLHIKKYYFIYFSCLFLNMTKAFSVSLSHFILTLSFFCKSVEFYNFFLRLEVFLPFLFYHAYFVHFNISLFMILVQLVPFYNTVQFWQFSSLLRIIACLPLQCLFHKVKARV